MPDDRLRELLREAAWLISNNASIMAQFLEGLDDVGAAYALRRTVADTRWAINLMRMLRRQPAATDQPSSEPAREAA
jgi:hypothetical protein